jgi:hypothetical protein
MEWLRLDILLKSEQLDFYGLRNFYRPGGGSERLVMSGVLKGPHVKWTREHFLIALNLYHKLEFGKPAQGESVDH